MKKKGSIIAAEIIQEWKREAYFKKVAIRRKLLKNKWRKNGEKSEDENIRH